MAELPPDFRPRLASKARLRWDAVEKKHMLVFPEAALVLNDSAAAILKLCDGERLVEQIVDALVEQFTGVDRNRDCPMEVYSYYFSLAYKRAVLLEITLRDYGCSSSLHSRS